MKYYRLSIMGSRVFPYEPWGSKENPANYYFYLKGHTPPDFPIVFPYQVLERTPPKDIIDSTFGATTKGFLVSLKAKEVLDSLSIENYMYHPIKMLVETRNTHVSQWPEWPNPYYYFHVFGSEYYDWIDFEKSIFSIPNEDKNINRVEFFIEDKNDFIKIKNHFYRINSKVLFLNKYFKDKSLDIFFTYRLGVGGWYPDIVVSDNFKKAIKKSKLKVSLEFIELPIYVD
ncbi:hypothetical protein [Runella zeae]|uniref:hypothetical protein n=1 Tax=Runella zeae TaxID=94255 RepID=UPI0003F6BA5D|nr:hypothetical protein [Runella zeae]